MQSAIVTNFRALSGPFGPATLPAVLFQEISQAVSEGEAAANDAAALRARLRLVTKKGDPGREHDIKRAISRINKAMEPIRSIVGRLLWDPQPEAEDRAIRAVSKRLGYERKQLKKMRA